MDQSAQSMIAAFGAGRQLKRQRELEAREEEDRKLMMEEQQLRLKALKLQDKLAKRQAGQQSYQFMQSIPGASQPAGQALGEQGADLYGRMQEILGQPTDREVEMPHPQMTLPAVEEAGIPEQAVTPPTLQQTQRTNLAMRVQDLMLKRRADEYEVPDVGTVPASAVPAAISGIFGARRQSAADTAAGQRSTAEIAGRQRVSETGAGATVQAAKISAGASAGRERGAGARSRQQMLVELNKALVASGREQVNKLPWEPETSLDLLQQTPEGSGVRRAGYGQEMPDWLVEQYVQQAIEQGHTGDEAVKIAEQWAQEDGWYIW